MDRIDKKIIAELQANGRLSITELAERIGLSLSPCHRRVKALEESGVIKGYHADLEASQIGFNFAAIIFVTLKDGDKRALSSFEEKVSEITNVIQAQRLFGNPDYLLHVVTKDLASFQKLYDDSLSALPNVQRLTSTIVLKSVVTNRLLPF